ncbi:class Ib ribonucleoside-diphosphate reductase assembly flavoprotein NrdI [Loigolactobacillus coryniformis]|jgi:protein involved in ribonucleotide reduction|uniref:class Ib ribonucleoside-diphosphate reductase assembly flavoprotein NrdI n=1 Tax=Loigolactobacillus coryniformis TaxID=1610 RepID=UPI001C5FECD2|nr:class Ib ribonucleoside-diphosphate reductase assembly flavoprotein NrdI [Loigolactobacillus coryniformis]MBW4803362.1 class Ib ribonucleoside-diphosphate reductase assembly flavoprotein NrdI [Loigolactobacillus coryniformis subsp. torquens]MBW4806058.1 class Ib ribonucleoside-diphosphate reductase assembly flavoprotein NrdI [Loigolactobacillus coryniformis subsp. torquens]
MPEPIRILYISISGNTRAFVEDLQEYAEQQHRTAADQPLITLKEISEASPLADETAPYFAFVPTYLDGGNGIDNGVKELLTNVLGEYIGYNANRQFCLGVVGSGNRNFNEQYCLTAKRYARDFGFPVIGDYELRGTPTDVKRIYATLQQIATQQEYHLK